MARAAKSKKPVEVVAERTTTDTVWANPDGTLTRDVAQGPIRAQNADGDLSPIDTTLEPVGDRFKPKVTAGRVSFSKNGEGDLATLDLAGDTSLSLRYVGSLGAGSAQGPTVVYPMRQGPAAPTVKVGAGVNGFAAHVRLGQAPEKAPTYRFEIGAKGLTPSLKDGVLSFRDSEDKVVARSKPLQMWDATRDKAGDPARVESVEAKLVNGPGAASTLVLTPSMEFLSDPDTKYPVTIDPDIASVARRGDTWYYSGQTSADSRADDFRLAIGSPDGTERRRAWTTFSYKSYLGQVVTKATLKVYQYFASSCTAKPMNLYPSANDVPGIIWGNQPAAVVSDRFKSQPSFNLGGIGCAAGFQSIDVTAIVNSWAGGHVNGDTDGRYRQGIHLRAVDEYDTTQEKRFCSWQPSSDTSVACHTSTRIPTLSLTYTADLGSQSWYSMTNHKLNESSGLSVNNMNGNAVVEATDAKVNGIGLDLTLGRTYNSQRPAYDPAVPATAVNATSMGLGWNMSAGPDVWLEHVSNFRYDYHGPSGAVLGSFVRKSANGADPLAYEFTSPVGGAKADLKGDQPNGTYTLTLHGSQTKYVFTNMLGHAYLTKIKDRSDNAITFAYSGITTTNKPKLSSITDSSGRSYAVTYTGNYITKVANTATGPGLREWKYAYTGDYLTAYTNPAGHTTNYSYTDMTSGPDLLSMITNPVNDSGARPTAGITYTAASGLNVNQVQQTSYQYGPQTTDAYLYTWNYNTTIVAACNGNGNTSTVVTDPNNHDTTYCYKRRIDDGADPDVERKTWVYDALGHAKSTQYSADNGPTNVTDPSGQGVSGGSTVATYSTQLPDQLQKVTAPKSDAAKNATTGFEYGASSVAGGAYLPTAVKGDNGNCNRFGYDSKGRTTAAYTGIAATSDSASSCGSEGGADVKGFHREYDDATGNVTASWDANSGSSPTSADKTIYTYWASGDAGYVADTANQLKSIRKPGGDCAATVAAGRKLCTTYTYDGAGRVTSVTNGNAQKTTYTHDKMDRTTAAYFGGTTGCNLDFRNCRTYVYDAEGNLVSRTEDDLLSSTFDYDQLNRQVAQYNPTALLQATDNIGMAYDGTGNLTAYAQLVNGVYDFAYYGYDAANRLQQIIDPTGNTYFAADSDGRTQSIAFPKPSGTNGVKVDYDYTKTGKPKTLDIETHAGANLVGFDYSYIVSLYGGLFQVETSQMRNRTVTGNLANLNSDVDYGYSKDNHLTSAMAASGTDYTYEYDNVGNITKEQGAATTYFGYDRAGQLCWKGSNTGAKLGQTCPATPTGNTTISHDPAGNITNTTSDPITYNDHDQVTNLGGVAMTYRDLGNDLRSTAGTTRTVSGPMGITATVTGSAITFYTRDPQGTLINAHNATSTTNYVTEYNGSVVALYNPSGSAVGSYKYSPYGATGVNNESGGATAANNPFRYISGYQDKTSGGADGYYKLGARYYDTHGHFTQADPIVRGGGNYAYTAGDPINSSDPSGMAAASDTSSAVAEFGKSMAGCLSVGSLTAGAYNAVATGIGYYGAAAAGVGAAMGTFGGGALLAATAGCTGFVIANGLSPEVGDAIGDVADAFGKASDGF